MRNVLRKRERVFVGWTSSRVKDYIDLPRCYKCQRFGDVAKFCNGRKACPRCAKDHDIRECKRTEDATWRYVNCHRDGRTELNHDRGDIWSQSNMKIRIGQVNCGRGVIATGELVKSARECECSVLCLQEPYRRGGRVAVAGARVLQERKVSAEQVWAAVVVLDDRVQVFGRDDESDRCCMVVDVKVSECELTVVSIYCKGYEDIRESLVKHRRILRRRRGKKVFIAGYFNAKSEVWHARELNERGERVEEFDTRGRVSNIDITMETMDVSRMFTGWKVQVELMSDHWMVVSELLVEGEGVGREIEGVMRRRRREDIQKNRGDLRENGRRNNTEIYRTRREMPVVERSTGGNEEKDEDGAAEMAKKEDGREKDGICGGEKKRKMEEEEKDPWEHSYRIIGGKLKNEVLLGGVMKEYGQITAGIEETLGEFLKVLVPDDTEEGEDNRHREKRERMEAAREGENVRNFTLEEVYWAIDRTKNSFLEE
ncbi:hypothetical protein J6590_055164 [Homalodisca vitripennis]|nr:hypothetical protein J6590_055164 [Homalodisca vitripennis]